MSASFLIFLATIAVVALPSGASPGISFTPRTNFTAPDVFFSNDNWPSDTTGSLSGTVLFAQNQVIPSKVRISGDMRPTLSALRTTLVMFKPSAGVVDNKYVLEMRVRAEDGTTVFTKRMDHPNDIPKQSSMEWCGPCKSHFQRHTVANDFYQRTIRFDQVERPFGNFSLATSCDEC